MAILRSVWKKLSGKGHTTTSATPAPNPEAQASTAPMRINLLTLLDEPTEPVPEAYMPLWVLQKQRQIIEVRVEGSSRSFQTLILAIDITRGLIWLDDLFPQHPTLDIGDSISLRHHCNGEQLAFSSPIVAWGDTFGANGLAILLPDLITYQPRRQHLRCDVRQTPTLNVRIRPIGQDISVGRVQDISVGGMRISLPGNFLGKISHGAYLPLCELDLSDELHIRCSAHVRAFRLERSPYRSTHISVEFADLAPERRQQLQQFLNNLNYLQDTPPRSRLSA